MTLTSTLKLVSVVKSPKRDKKWRASFSDGTKTDFGARGYEDYTQHGDKGRKRWYICRHKHDLETNDPRRAGYLSMFLLWNKATMQASLRDYKSRLQGWNDNKRQWSRPDGSPAKCHS